VAARAVAAVAVVAAAAVVGAAVTVVAAAKAGAVATEAVVQVAAVPALVVPVPVPVPVRLVRVAAVGVAGAAERPEAAITIAIARADQAAPAIPAPEPARAAAPALEPDSLARTIRDVTVAEIGTGIEIATVIVIATVIGIEIGMMRAFAIEIDTGITSMTPIARTITQTTEDTATARMPMIAAIAMGCTPGRATGVAAKAMTPNDRISTVTATWDSCQSLASGAAIKAPIAMDSCAAIRKASRIGRDISSGEVFAASLLRRIPQGLRGQSHEADLWTEWARSFLFGT